MRGAWIEISAAAQHIIGMPSLPMRGAWIEITEPMALNTPMYVAPHAGSVD